MRLGPDIAAPESFDAGDFLVRRYEIGDGPALNEAVIASYEHLAPWMPWAKPDPTIADSEQTVRRSLARYLSNEDYTLGVWKGDKLVGSTGFHLRVGRPEWGNAEIGMWIHRAHAGSGLGTQVLQAMLRWGFTEWNWYRLVWRCDSDNLASARVAQKGGLTLDGILRQDQLREDGSRCDLHLYSMLRPEWVAMNS